MTETVSWRTVLKCAAPGLVVALLCLAPFLHKAYTIDEPYFLTEARQALHDPLNPTATSICWENVGYARRLREIGSPAVLVAYLLTPVVLLGSAEWAGHLLGILVCLAAVVATAALGLRCGLSRTQATWAALFYASTPVSLAMAGTVMPDILSTALAAIGLERLMAWRSEGRLHQAICAGAALGLAPTARFHTVLLWGVACLILLGATWPRSTAEVRALGWRRWLPVVVALMVLVAFTWITRDPAAQASAMGPNRSQVGRVHLDSGLPQFGINYLLATTFAVAFLALEGLWGLGAACLTLLAGVAFWQVRPDTAVRDSLGILGFAAIALVLRWAWKKADRIWFCLALCLLMPLPMIVYIHLPPKYLTPCIPAAAILLAQRFSERGGKLRTPAAAFVVVAGAIGGVLILQADAQFAGLSRSVMAEEVVPRLRPGQHAWYSGQWSLFWYGEKAGASCLTTAPPRPQPGDLVVADELDGGIEFATSLDLKLTLLKEIAPVEPGGRIMNIQAHAGFYSNGHGFLPWAWSAAPLNIYDVWQVR